MRVGSAEVGVRVLERILGPGADARIFLFRYILPGLAMLGLAFTYIGLYLPAALTPAWNVVGSATAAEAVLLIFALFGLGLILRILPIDKLPVVKSHVERHEDALYRALEERNRNTPNVLPAAGSYLSEEPGPSAFDVAMARMLRRLSSSMSGHFIRRKRKAAWRRRWRAVWRYLLWDQFDSSGMRFVEASRFWWFALATLSWAFTLATLVTGYFQQWRLWWIPIGAGLAASFVVRRALKDVETYVEHGLVLIETLPVTR